MSENTNESKSNVVPISVRIRPDQRQMLEEHSKRWGYSNVSLSLRVVLDEWNAMQQARSTEQHTPVSVE